MARASFVTLHLQKRCRFRKVTVRMFEMVYINISTSLRTPTALDNYLSGRTHQASSLDPSEIGTGHLIGSNSLLTIWDSKLDIYSYNKQVIWHARQVNDAHQTTVFRCLQNSWYYFSPLYSFVWLYRTPQTWSMNENFLCRCMIGTNSATHQWTW